MIKVELLKRLYKDYTKKHIRKILLSVFFSVLVAGSTSAIAWLLDPAIDLENFFRERSIAYFNNSNFNYFSILNKRDFFVRCKNFNDKCWGRGKKKTSNRYAWIVDKSRYPIH